MAFWFRKKRAKKGNTPFRLGYLIDGGYDGYHKSAILTFLDPKTQELFKWNDNTGHLSYLNTEATIEEVKELIGEDPDFVDVVEVIKYDAIEDKPRKIRKVIATNPLAIGGGGDRAERSFRNILQQKYKVWEAWIRYHSCYVYDKQLEFCMPYLVSEDTIRPYVQKKTQTRIDEVLDIITSHITSSTMLKHWIRLFETEFLTLKRCALDIETEPDKNRVPNVDLAIQPIICISFVTSDNRKIVFLLRREGLVEEIDLNAEIIFFNDERNLILSIFKIIKQYPAIVTFNGDVFDLQYIYNRALNLNIPKNSIPLYKKGRKPELNIKDGLHIDLYQFLKNKSIQNYAFKGKYKHYGLNDISNALLGKGKIHFEIPMMEMTYEELAKYCLNDSELTYELTSFNKNIMMNLIFTLSRMANLPIQEIVRYKISTWTRSTFFYYHRVNDILIPTKEELAKKGSIQTTAKIEGKKYQGAIVREPLPGTFFNVVVMDFASLYPSEVKDKNVCYSTINCNHEECKTNIVPYTTHHICTRREGISPKIIGSLRDARVYFYKPQSKKHSDSMVRAFYSVFEQAIKVYINASYGIFGSEHFALYTPPVAEAITAYARQDMTAIVNKAIEMGINLIGGDTDSIFLDNPTFEQVKELQKWATDELELDLGIDKVYRYGMFSKRKKNYIGIFKDGTLDIKGLTGKKSHTPDIFKIPFYKITKLFSSVMTPDDVEPTKKKIQKIVSEYYLKIKNKEFELEELAFHVTLGKALEQYDTNPQHVKAARILVEGGHQVEAGDVIHYIKSTNKEKVFPLGVGVDIGLGAFMDDIETNIRTLVNRDVYIKQLKSTMEQLLDPLDIDFETDIEGKLPEKNQKSLAEFLPKIN